MVDNPRADPARPSRNWCGHPSAVHRWIWLPSVARSIVVAEDRVLGTRYRLLETIRQYGEQRLADCQETETMLTQHAHYYADLSAYSAEKSYGQTVDLDPADNH